MFGHSLWENKISVHIIAYHFLTSSKKRARVQVCSFINFLVERSLQVTDKQMERTGGGWGWVDGWMDGRGSYGKDAVWFNSHRPIADMLVSDLHTIANHEPIP